MSNVVELTISDFIVGTHLPWDVYDKEGLLLLKQNSTIVSERQLVALLTRGLCRKKSNKELENEKASKETFKDESCPFDHLTEITNRLNDVTKDIFTVTNNSTSSVEQRLRKISSDLQALAQTDSDALLGAVHLCFENTYSIMHAIHTAILCEIIGKHFIEESGRRNTVMCAALTSNISMCHIQDCLQDHSEPLNQEQRKLIETHPESVVHILKENGIKNPLWLKSVLQHHEHLDGSGYPNKIKGDEILIEANLISITDRYAAMIAGRNYRKGRHPKEVLKQIFVDRGKLYPEKLCLMLIKELGIYPPGALVSLNNGEKGVVIKRSQDSVSPIVASILSPRGAPYSKPIPRDCSDVSFKIDKICEPEKRIPLNLPIVWGYR